MKKILIILFAVIAVIACKPTKKGYTLPDPHDVIMYEVNPLVFAQEGPLMLLPIDWTPSEPWVSM